MPIKHSFVSAIPDGPDDTLVRPSDWNAEHVVDGTLTMDATTAPSAVSSKGQLYVKTDGGITKLYFKGDDGTEHGPFQGSVSGANTGDQNIFQTIAVSGQSNVVADSTTDTLTIAGAGLVSVTTNDSTDTLTITGANPVESFIIACSDETTAITTGNNKVKFRMPYAFTVSAVRASLSTAQGSGNIFTVDINEAGTSIISTKLTIDNTELTSTTAATPPVISDSALADDAEISIDVDQIGDGTAKGLKVVIIGTRA
jgi:hypothetical protein